MVLDFSPEYPRFSQPKWLGQEDIRDKTVLLCADDGLGDILQFARDVPLLAARGANIVLVVQDALRPRLAGLPAVSQCLPFGAKAYPPFDFHCPIMSLPLAFGTTLETIPAGPYLARPRLAGSPRRSRPLARWSCVVRQSQAGQRPQPLDAICNARAPA